MYYARIVFDTNASVAERHDDVHSARRWIESEGRERRAERFRLGQIYQTRPEWKLVQTLDTRGWHAS